MTEIITSLITSLGTLITGLFSTATAEGGAAIGIGVLTGGVLGVALLRKGAFKAKKAMN